MNKYFLAVKTIIFEKKVTGTRHRHQYYNIDVYVYHLRRYKYKGGT